LVKITCISANTCPFSDLGAGRWKVLSHLHPRAGHHPRDWGPL
jgi:hypothetical protein